MKNPIEIKYTRLNSGYYYVKEVHQDGSTIEAFVDQSIKIKDHLKKKYPNIIITECSKLEII